MLKARAVKTQVNLSSRHVDRRRSTALRRALRNRQSLLRAVAQYPDTARRRYAFGVESEQRGRNRAAERVNDFETVGEIIY